MADSQPEGALQHARRLQQLAAADGFDWSEPEPLWAKLAEEIAELRAARNAAEQQEELGDLLFMVVNIARHLRVDAEQALIAANTKFSRRYSQVVDNAQALPPPGDPRRLQEMERRWQAAKANEHAKAGWPA